MRERSQAKRSRWLFLLLGIVLAGAIYQASTIRKRPINVLLISIDSLRADHLGCYGYERKTSPEIDALSRQGVVFLNPISATSWTLPSHMSLLTAQDISVHGVATDGFSLHPRIPTLPEILKKKGYATACFCTSPYMNPAFGFDRGFDRYHNTDFERPGFEDTILPPAEQRDAVHEDITSPRITELATAWLEENRRRPFFLFLHMWDVHYDYVPPPPYDALFDPGYTGTVSGKGYIHNEEINPDMDPRDLEHVIALYDGEIAFTDYHLGLIFQKLKELGIYERTLIVVTADHGDEFFEHGNKGHRITLYDEVIRVPLVVKLPGKETEPRKVKIQVGLIDVAPTILEVIGLPLPEQMQGKSLLPLMRDQGACPERPVLAELSPVLYALRTSGWKLLYNEVENVSVILDLESDPKETHRSLITSSPLRKEVEERFRVRREYDRMLAVKYRGGAVGTQVKMSEEEKKRLRDLGYMQ